MTPHKIAAELVELSHHDARLIARIAKATDKLAENAKRRCELMQCGGDALVSARVLERDEVTPMVVRPKPDEE